MQTEFVPFDCAAPLRTWQDDPTKTPLDIALSMLECYSQAYRMMALEIRRLEAINQELRLRLNRGCADESELQRFVDASIRNLDPDRF